MAIALETFVKNLEDSGIISPSKLKVFLPPQAAPKDAQELARQLIQQKQLTKFQAQEIYQGRAKSLILGNYTILDKIGAGGMGQVFKAEHRRMHRIVAIKTLPTKMMKDPAAVARFEREVHAAAKLSHANIVAAHDADEANGVYFLVMEYVEGADLSALVKKNGPFPVAKACNYILQAARGLEFAHKKGVVHRDIKPANLLLDNEGTVKILDMGLARIDAGDGAAQAELTGTGMVMGTVDYMAPEQATSTHHADARADIYSLGCSLHYLIVGKATYGGETVIEKLLAHRDKPIPKLRESQPEVSDDLQAIFEKMVAKTVEDRYQTMTEVIADLERLIAGQSASFSGPKIVTAADVGTVTFLKDDAAVTPRKVKAPTSGKINKKLVTGVAAAVVVLLAIVGGWSLMGSRGGPRPDGRQAKNERPSPPPGKPPGKPTPKPAPPPPVGPPKGDSRPSAAPVASATDDFALEFDGRTSYVSLPLTYDQSHPVTIEATIWPLNPLEELGSIGPLASIISNTERAGIDLSISEKRGIQAGMAYEKAGNPQYLILADDAPRFSGERTRIAAVFNGRQVQLAQDGRVVSSAVADGEPIPSNMQMILGGNPMADNKTIHLFFRGRMDEVRISKIARKEQLLTTTPRLEADADTIALYHFDEGRGDVLKDSSSNNRHGKIVGAKWVKADDPLSPIGPIKAALPTAWTPRSMAEWTIRRGGKVWIGNQKDIAKVEDLPAVVTYLTVVSLEGVRDLDEKDVTTIISWSEDFGLSFGLIFYDTPLTDEGLRRLAAVKTRGSLSINRTRITGAGFDAWTGRPIGTLVVDGCPISPAGWQNIARLGNLTQLYVGRTTFGNEELRETVSRHPELTFLDAEECPLNDDALDHLQSLKNLTYLNLTSTLVTDEAVPKLAKLSSLQTLQLKKTKVSAARIDALTKALPNCKIE